MLQYVGQIHMPDSSGGDDLLGYFFEFGPTKAEGPAEIGDVLDWARALGIEWQPWQSRLFVRLSREYVAAQHAARPENALPPWPAAVNMWRWVRNQKAERRLDQDEAAIDQRMREKAANGNRK